MKANTRTTRAVILGILLLLPMLALSQSRADIDKAIDENVGNHVKFQHMMTTLQQAVAYHSPSAVAALVAYPITINPHTKQAFTIHNQKAFIDSYDKIITPAIASVIEKQKYEDLFVSYRGAMFGDGEVWVIGICRNGDYKQTDIKIRTIQNATAK